jgi:ribonucleoside-diphosphate reductase alpha subunit
MSQSESNTHELYVRKRNGDLESVSFDKILRRIKALSTINGVELNINFTTLTMKIIDQLYDNIKTSEIDELTSQQCASMSTQNMDYGTLAARIMISNHHKNTTDDFFKIIDSLYYFNDVNGIHHPLISRNLYCVVKDNAELIQSKFDFSRDYKLDYFGFKTLEKAYLMRLNGTIIERPQHMWMRVSLGIHGSDLDAAFETYDLMSQKYFTHATPTLFNSGTPRPQMSSCYLLAMEDDSIKGIYNTLGECAAISKWAGGIGLHIHNVRSKGSQIRGTNGVTDGLVPMLRVYNSTARYVNQSGKRNGSFAMYLEPWHADVFDFLELKKNHGDEEMKARDLFYALWIPDLFMKRVKQDGKWTLMCPDKCPGLSDAYGEEFDELYTKYENENRGSKTVQARDLWVKILDSQIETGTPYMLYKDSANKKSNQKNLGTIKSSNLCTEILEYSDDKETAVCNLASIGLPMFVEPPNVDHITSVKLFTKTNCVYCDAAKAHLDELGIDFTCEVLDDDVVRHAKYEELNAELKPETPINSVPQIFINGEYIGGASDLIKKLNYTFNYDKLHQVTKVVTNNLNKVIDVNFYPTDKTRLSNLKNRPIGIGVQGLADVYAIMSLPFTSAEAQEINEKIFETIYHASCEKSMELAKERKIDMAVLRVAYRNRKFYFCDNTKPDNNEYVINQDTPDEIKRLLHTHRPIYNEMFSLPDDFSGAYSTFSDSPASKGILQFDMWNEEPSSRYDWETLKQNIQTHGMRNSLLVAPMPTASTSQILGNNECFEPFTSNIYLRRTLAGEFIVINKHLMMKLTNMGLWNEDVKNSIILHKGSIQQLTHLPKYIRDTYKIVWEMPMRHLIDMAHHRGKYICQSQSMNLWMENPTYDKLTAMHFYAWGKGLKTGIYYLRTKAKAAAQQFTIDPSKISKYQEQQNSKLEDDDEGCLMCSG